MSRGNESSARRRGGVIFSPVVKGPCGTGGAPRPSICADHLTSAFLYDSFTNFLLPSYGPSNLIELARQPPPRWIKVTYYLSMLCAFAEGLFVMGPGGVDPGEQTTLAAHRERSSRAEETHEPTRRTDPYESWNATRRKCRKYTRKAFGVIALGALLLMLAK